RRDGQRPARQRPARRRRPVRRRRHPALPPGARAAPGPRARRTGAPKSFPPRSGGGLYGPVPAARIPAAPSGNGTLVVQRQPRLAVPTGLPARGSCGGGAGRSEDFLVLPRRAGRVVECRGRTNQPPVGRVGRPVGGATAPAPGVGLSL